MKKKLKFVKAHEAAPVENEAMKAKMAAAAENMISCRYSVGSKLEVAEPWESGKPVSFIYAPAGISTISAGFRAKETITCTIQVDEDTAKDVQESFDYVCATEKQEPFGDEDHEAKKATLRFPPTTTFSYGTIKSHEGLIIAGGEPTSYGAESVNGKVYRSWSGEFATDADYAKAHCKKSHWTFPDGVRGSESNPARIIAVYTVLGALTNKPAFKNMPPVKAKKAELEEDLIKAGAPMGNKNAAKDRMNLSHDANEATAKAFRTGMLGGHEAAKDSHKLASEAYKATGTHLERVGFHIGRIRMHEGEIDRMNHFKSTDETESETVKASDDTADANLGTLNTAKLNGVKARYNVVKKGDKWHVVNKDGKDEGESDSKEKAEAHLRALYANSPDTKAMEAKDVDAEIVKAFEAMVDEDLVKATGTSEGVKKSWEKRSHGQHFAKLGEVGEDEHVWSDLGGGQLVHSTKGSKGDMSHYFHMGEHEGSPSMEVTKRRKFGSDVHTVGLNWSAHGTQDLEHSQKFHDLMGHALEFAKREGASSGSTKATDKTSLLDTLYARNDENQRIVDGFTKRIPNIGSREIVDKFCAKVGAKKATAQP